MTLGGSNSDSVAQDQLKAFVERIMRMREEAKAINDDIREIYAEAKANGFDKTVLGKLVLYVEKRGKDKASVAEADALFDLYLEAFDGRPSRTHAHEGANNGLAGPALLQGSSLPANTKPATNPEAPGGPTAGEGSDALPADTVFPGVEHVSPETPSLSEAVHDANEGGRHEALTPLQLANGKPDADTGAAANVIENDGKDRADGQGISSAVEPGAPPLSIAAAAILARRPWCLHAHNTNKCGGYGKQHCGPCLKAHADDVGETA